jgi:hypothetical protein
MNRPGSEVEKMDEMLESGDNPPLFELLQLSARGSFDKRAFTLAVVASFQALEVFLENYIMSKYAQRGLSVADIADSLDRKWRTKTRLTEVLEELTRQSANKQPFWDRWCNAYDRTRNETIHAGKDPTEKEAAEVLLLNSEIINWIKSLT